MKNGIDIILISNLLLWKIKNTIDAKRADRATIIGGISVIILLRLPILPEKFAKMKARKLKNYPPFSGG
jgi:hypothetical protein